MTEQNASASGHGNIIVQMVGDNNRYNPDPASLNLIPWQRRVRRVKVAIDILDPACQAVPLVGREDDQAFLQAWQFGRRDNV